MDCDVLVVGAGPTGLLLACELARGGSSVRLIERRRAPSDKSKALAVHARTLEVWEDIGIVDEALARGRRIHGMNLYSGESRLAHVSLDDLDSAYRIVLVLPQNETEAILTQHALRLGVTIERERELVGLRQESEGVTSTIRAGEEQHVLRSRFVVGCDGAHSRVRQELGLSYEGADVPASFVFADAALDWSLPDDEAHAFFSPEGPAVCIPLPAHGRWRVIVGLPEGEQIPDEVSLVHVERLLMDRVSVPLTLNDPDWLAGFDVHQRKVQRYRVGRVFVAGDAAHCHSPVGGQGMNTGLQDAYNLGWRLALVARGLGRSELLDAYEPEREPVAAALLRGTELATRGVSLRSPLTQGVRNHVISFLGGLDVVRQRIARQIGELTVGYRRSPLVAEDRSSVLSADLRRSPASELPSLGDWKDFSAAPRPGDRAPDVLFTSPGGEQRLYPLLRGPGHTLLLFDGAAATEAGYSGFQSLIARVRARYGDLVQMLVVIPAQGPPPALEGEAGLVLDPSGELHAAYGAGSECLYLVRPDGYVGYRAQPADAGRLLAYLGRVFV